MMPESPKQFVLLHHVLRDGQHWDLCLEQGSALTTWQLLAHSLSEISQGRQAVPAHRLEDHRRAYLDYEGPVSGGRGHVTRADRGTYELLEQRLDRWTVCFSGSLIIGTYEIATVAHSQVWEFRKA